MSEEPEISRDELLRISALSGLIWLVLGTLILLYWQQTDLAAALFEGRSILIQLTAGIASGAIFGYAGSRLIQVKEYQKISEDLKIVRVIRRAGLRKSDVVVISATAGITEEWLFRAALQPVLGLTLASVLFVAVHGYFSFKSRHHIAFGGFMLLLSFALGLLFEFVGLISAMSAHVVYDIWVINRLRRRG
jgi:hypothetical protein